MDYKPFNKLESIKQQPEYINKFYETFKMKQNDFSFPMDIKYFEKETQNKKGFAFWAVSHCETPSRREAYVKELRKYIPIDIYGKCGDYFEDSEKDPCNNTECWNQLFNSYKFYISFENGLCDDYITEKTVEVL